MPQVSHLPPLIRLQLRDEEKTRRMPLKELERLRSACRAGPLEGKRVVFVVADDCPSRSKPLEALSGHDASPRSMVMDYAELLADAPTMEANLLILADPGQLSLRKSAPLTKAAIEAFRRNNPDSVIIVDGTRLNGHDSLRQLWDSGTVNVIVTKEENASYAQLIELGKNVIDEMRH